ncbi:MAG: ATPase [Coriobacteriales bacterium]|nr:ATPase [Coriobacteriales bacterium]
MDDFAVVGLLDDLSIIIEDSKPPSLGSKDKRLVDLKQVLDFIDDIKSAFPLDFEQARMISRERDDILSSAQAEANRIIEDARNQALLIAGEQEVVRIAREKAADIEADALVTARETRAGADDYADRVFSHLQDTVASVNDNLTRCRERLNNKGFR